MGFKEGSVMTPTICRRLDGKFELQYGGFDENGIYQTLFKTYATVGDLLTDLFPTSFFDQVYDEEYMRSFIEGGLK
jgi:hypothetical protein